LAKRLAGLNLDVIPIQEALDEEAKYSVLEGSLLSANVFGEIPWEIVLEDSLIEELKSMVINYHLIIDSLEFKMFDITSLTSSTNVPFPTRFFIYNIGS
jgi:hypothetical protein